MAQALVLDEFLPAYDHVVSVSQVFRSPPEQVLQAAVTVDLYQLPLARLLIGVRGLPARISDATARHRAEAVVPPPTTFRIRDLPAHGWFLLGERPGAELVFGTVTKPWRALGGAPVPPVTAANFAGFTVAHAARVSVASNCF